MLLWKVAREFLHPLYSTDLPIAQFQWSRHSLCLSSHQPGCISYHVKLIHFQDFDLQVPLRLPSPVLSLSRFLSISRFILTESDLCLLCVICRLSHLSQVWWTVSFFLFANFLFLFSHPHITDLAIQFYQCTHFISTLNYFQVPLSRTFPQMPITKTICNKTICFALSQCTANL